MGYVDGSVWLHYCCPSVERYLRNGLGFEWLINS